MGGCYSSKNQPIQSVLVQSSLSHGFGASDAIGQVENKFTQTRSERTTCSLYPAISDGIWRIQLVFRDCSNPFRIGLVPGGVEIDNGYDLGEDENSVAYYSLFGSLTSNGRVLPGNCSLHNNDHILMELTMSSFPRTCVFYVNREKQPNFVRNLPSSVSIAFMFANKGASLEVVSFDCYGAPLKHRGTTSASIFWTGTPVVPSRLSTTYPQIPVNPLLYSIQNSPSQSSDLSQEMDLVESQPESKSTQSPVDESPGPLPCSLSLPTAALTYPPPVKPTRTAPSPLATHKRKHTPTLHPLKELAPPVRLPAEPVSMTQPCISPYKASPHLSSTTSLQSSSSNQHKLMRRSSSTISSLISPNQDSGNESQKNVDVISPLVTRSLSEDEKLPSNSFVNTSKENQLLLISPNVKTGIVRINLTIQTLKNRNAVGIIVPKTAIFNTQLLSAIPDALFFTQKRGSLISHRFQRDCFFPWISQDMVSLEANMTSSPPHLSFYINNRQQPVMVHAIPSHFSFCVFLIPNATVRVLSYDILPSSTVQPYLGSFSFDFAEISSFIEATSPRVGDQIPPSNSEDAPVSKDDLV
ncbi:hypothetical protein BLNAU_17885 [Blattamonas nauphoetae]|uniref:Uncharacterized protein n=1 Tax=Blattamonas nauphoetae TaxID=2049346 RepID=A0ABQ9X5Z4_9EUKA|nr:hypothetical protein BLNAU_17885 [Blattamonas nauphoetae]